MARYMLFRLIALFVLMASAALTAADAQTTVTFTPIGIAKIVVRSDSIIYSRTSTIHVGKEGHRNPPHTIYRAALALSASSLDLQVDEVVDGASMIVQFSGPRSYTTKITTMTTDPLQNGDATAWTAIGAGASFWDAVTTSGVPQTLAPPGLKAMMQALIADSRAILSFGFLCNSENDSASTPVGITFSFNISKHRVPVHFTIKNSFDAGIIHVDGAQVNSGAGYDWYHGTIHPLGAIDQPYLEYNYVWNDALPLNKSIWRKQLSDGTTLDIPFAYNRTHPFLALVDDKNATIKAMMKKLCTITLFEKAEFDGPINAGVVATVVEGNDVMITAPSQITVGGHTYPFSAWSDGLGTNPRTVRPTDHISLTALYKMHLASNNNFVGYAGGQRHLASASAGYYRYLVYESAGDIWSSMSFGGSAFSTETRVTPGLGGNQDPSICAQGSWAYATWEKVAGATHTIYFAKYTGAGGWQTPRAVISFSQNPPSPPLHARPVIGLYRDSPSGVKPIFISYMVGGSTYEYRSSDDGLTWSALQTLPGLTPSYDDLSLPMYGTFLHQQNGVYKLSRNYSGGWETIDRVPGSYWVNFSGESDFTQSSCSSPTIASAMYYGRVYLGWQEDQVCEYNHRYVVQQGWSNQNGWATVTAYETNPDVELSSPSLAMGPNQGVMLWSEATQIKQVKVLHSSGLWDPPSNAGFGQYPSLELGDPVYSPVYFSTQFSSPFTMLNAATVSLQKADAATPAKGMEYARVLFAVDTVSNRTFSIRMSQPKIGARRMQFVPVNDTLPGIEAENFFAFLATDQLPVESARDTLEFGLSVSSKGFDNDSLALNLSFDGMDGNSKLAPVLAITHRLQERHRGLKVKLALTNLAGRQVRLEPLNKALTGLGGSWVFNIAHVYSDRTPKPAKIEEKLSQAASSVVPTAFSLSGYPNPFNPSTTIRYGLPRNATVHLTVFNSLGQEVAELVNGEVEAGYHEVRFDASSLSSGVYFYRLRADDFVETQRLLLLK